MTKTWIGALGFTTLLALASCGNIGAGTTCHSSDDCDDGQSCVPIAFGCVDIKACESTCEVPCASHEDCGGGEFCLNRNGRLICGEIDPEQPGE